MIIKFKSFGQRMKMYRTRKKAKDDVKVKVDLTRRRLRILIEAIEFGKSNEK